MGPAPSLATYEAQAQSEYAPQQQAESTAMTATHQAALNTLGTQLKDTGAQYDTQEATLKSTVQQEAATIAQTYTTHLLGNFSGLQGNDMGEMFSKANMQEQSIETQRSNAIDAINTSIANENLTYSANSNALVSKYQGLEASAADSAYNTAEKNYETQQLDLAKMQQTQANSDRSYNLSVAKLGVSQNNAATKAQNTYLSQFKATAKKNNAGYSYTGPNGESIDLGQYAMAITQGNTDNALGIVTNQLSQSPTSYDKQALGYIGTLQKQGKSSSAILKAVQSKYSMDFGGTL